MDHLWMVLLQLLILCLTVTECDQHMKQLVTDMLYSGYNKHARPRHSKTQTLTYVKMGMSLESVIDLEWNDHTLQWDPEDYGGIDRIHVPPDKVWKPDIVLYNSADGNFTVKTKYKIIIHHNGRIIWRPPSIFKSLCAIDVTYFPFDTQNCHLKLGSWTHDTRAVDIYHKNFNLGNRSNLELIETGIDLDRYGESTEWDLLNISARKFEPNYPCCEYTFPDIKFYVTLRRKPLFYMVNLIIPCVAICSVTVLVFYIPAMSAEKITMGITILNALTVFLLLVVDITPPTSFSTPLIGKYLVFTMSLVTLSIVVTVLVLNVHFGSPLLRDMPGWTREIFLNILPKLLLIRPPTSRLNRRAVPSFSRKKGAEYDRCDSKENLRSHYSFEGLKSYGDVDYTVLPKPVLQTMIGVSSIADSLTQAEESKNKSDDWQYVALVIDRLCLYMFIGACLLGTLGTLMQAPSHYDHRPGFSQREQAPCDVPGQGCWYQISDPY